MIGATWADRIKSAVGYADDNPADRNQCGAVSAQNVGFTDYFRHRCWYSPQKLHLFWDDLLSAELK